MGRLLKRVSLDFRWTLNKVWTGYLNPYYSKREKCKACEETGYSQFARELNDKWYDSHGRKERLPNGGQRSIDAIQYNLNEEDIAALIKSNRLMEFTRVPINDEQKEIVKKQLAEGQNSWLRFDNGYIPTPEEVNEWAKKGMGHCGVSQYVVVKARCEKEGEAHICDVCSGEGYLWASEEDRVNYEEWKKEEPPTGEGFQLWEDTSEGSPISPVFKTLEELCAYCSKNCSTFGKVMTTKEEWMRMLSENNVHHKIGNMTFI
jgi:hypothetical protein